MIDLGQILVFFINSPYRLDTEEPFRVTFYVLHFILIASLSISDLTQLKLTKTHHPSRSLSSLRTLFLKNIPEKLLHIEPHFYFPILVSYKTCHLFMDNYRLMVLWWQQADCTELTESGWDEDYSA